MEEKMKKNVPLGRMAHPSDPAKAIVFLCSKRAESIISQAAQALAKEADIKVIKTFEMDKAKAAQDSKAEATK